MMLNKVKFLNTSEDERMKTNGIPLVITHHTLLNNFSKVISKHLHLLHIINVKKHLLLVPWFHFGEH